jgi:hypothetical protein
VLSVIICPWLSDHETVAVRTVEEIKKSVPTDNILKFLFSSSAL